MAILFRGTGGELVFCTVGWDASCYISEGKISIEYCKCDDSLNNDHFHSRCYCWLNEHSHCKSTLFTLVGDYRLESSSKFTEHIKEVYLLGITMYVECYIFFFFFFDWWFKKIDSRPFCDAPTSNTIDMRFLVSPFEFPSSLRWKCVLIGSHLKVLYIDSKEASRHFS